MSTMSGKHSELLQQNADVPGNTQRSEFISQAQTALEQARVSGLGYDADEVHAYIRALVSGKKALRPTAIKWRV
jgi:hypothetical protein